MIDSEDRGVFLNKECAALGASWAERWVAQLRGQGRSVEGGWPGTLPEAKSIVRGHLDSELARLHLRSLNNDECVVATRATYDHAKRSWQSAVRSLKPRGSSGKTSLGEVAT